MLPRRFALIRHVDYSGGAGTGVIAYGVAFDDGQVVLRWSSAHRATSVLDSVEDLIAAHGHGETTSIEWIDAPPGKADAPAPAGRRARRPTLPAEEQSATDVQQVAKPPATAPAEPADARPGPQMPEPDGPAHARPAAQAPQPAPGPADGEHTSAPIAQAGGGAASAPSTADPAQPAPGSTAAGPTTPAQPATPPLPATPARPATPAQPAAPTQPTPPEQPATPVPPPSAQPAAAERPAAAAQPTAPASAHPASAQPAPATPAPEQPAASTPSWEPAQSTDDSSTQPNVAASLGVARMAQKASSGHEPASEKPAPAARPAAHASPASNGAANLPNATYPAETPFSRTASSRDDERRARHEAIATQPMSAEFSDEPEPRRPRRAGPPTHESPRSIFEEAEQPSRPDLRLASSNGQAHEPDEVDDSGSESAHREAFGGFFSTGHQHLETVTGLLDLPAGLDKRGRGAESDQDAIASRRNGRHRGE